MNEGRTFNQTMELSDLCVGLHYLVPGLDALVDIFRERLPGDEAPHSLENVQFAVFKHNLPLADNHQGSPMALHSFKNVVFESLERIKGRVFVEQGTGIIIL